MGGMEKEPALSHFPQRFVQQTGLANGRESFGWQNRMDDTILAAKFVGCPAVSVKVSLPVPVY